MTYLPPGCGGWQIPPTSEFPAGAEIAIDELCALMGRKWVEFKGCWHSLWRNAREFLDSLQPNNEMPWMWVRVDVSISLGIWEQPALSGCAASLPKGATWEPRCPNPLIWVSGAAHSSTLPACPEGHLYCPGIPQHLGSSFLMCGAANQICNQ